MFDKLKKKAIAAAKKQGQAALSGFVAVQEDDEDDDDDDEDADLEDFDDLDLDDEDLEDIAAQVFA